MASVWTTEEIDGDTPETCLFYKATSSGYYSALLDASFISESGSEWNCLCCQICGRKNGYS